VSADIGSALGVPSSLSNVHLKKILMLLATPQVTVFFNTAQCLLPRFKTSIKSFLELSNTNFKNSQPQCSVHSRRRVRAALKELINPSVGQQQGLFGLGLLYLCFHDYVYVKYYNRLIRYFEID
jgi:hypothetical protein